MPFDFNVFPACFSAGAWPKVNLDSFSSLLITRSVPKFNVFFIKAEALSVEVSQCNIFRPLILSFGGKNLKHFLVLGVSEKNEGLLQA